MDYRPSVPPSSMRQQPVQPSFEPPGSVRFNGIPPPPSSTQPDFAAQSGGFGPSQGASFSKRVPSGKPPRGLPAAVELLVCFGSIRAQVCVAAVAIGLIIPINQYLHSPRPDPSATQDPEPPPQSPETVQATVVSVELPKTIQRMRARIEYRKSSTDSDNEDKRAGDPYDDDRLVESFDNPTDRANTEDDSDQGDLPSAEELPPGREVTQFTQYVRQDYMVTYEYWLDGRLYGGKYESKTKPDVEEGDSIEVKHSANNLIRDKPVVIDPYEEWPFDPKYLVLVAGAFVILLPEIMRGVELIRLLRKGYYGAGIVTGTAKQVATRWWRRAWYCTTFDVQVVPTSGQMATVPGAPPSGIGSGANQGQQATQWQSVGFFTYESPDACKVPLGGAVPVIFELTDERSCTPLGQLPFGIKVKDNGAVVMDPVRLLTLIPTLVVIVIALLLGM